MKTLLSKSQVFILFLVVSFIRVEAQIDESSELYKTLKEKDSLLFEISFNKCEIGQLENLTDEDFEFYHDQSGITKTKSAFIESIQQGICNLSYKPRRELVEGTLKVYPLYNSGVLYGAIQKGEHRFLAIEKNKEPYLTSTARFTHLWIKKEDTWKLTRVFSYNHIPAN